MGLLHKLLEIGRGFQTIEYFDTPYSLKVLNTRRMYERKSNKTVALH